MESNIRPYDGMTTQPEDTTQVVRRGVERACKDFTERIAPLGFTRSKKMFWTRVRAHTVDVIHLHRNGISYGKPLNCSVSFRVHFAVRVLNDIFEAINLNGPNSDAPMFRKGLYHLRFNAQTGSTYDRCVDDLVRLTLDEGEVWFKQFENYQQLLNEKRSPLMAIAIERLRAAIDGNQEPDAIVFSRKLLGLK